MAVSSAPLSADVEIGVEVGAPIIEATTTLKFSAVPVVSVRVSELLEASQAQIHCMETTLVSMLQVAKRWTEGGVDEPGMEGSLREQFSSN
jgi:hypothetical protein